MKLDRARWSRIERVLDLVLDAAPHERDHLIDELCGDDVELRREVRAMLVSCADAEDRFEEPPPVTAGILTGSPGSGRDEWTRVAPGTVIGRWRIQRELGRGGMGAVFLAERADGQFEKSAALKIVKRGMDSDEILQRFSHERQILAHLEHPHIAALFDGGRTDDGLPYFVMELAHGRPIDEHCDGNRLGVRDRLELFLTVCDAVHHAHRNLIVHRDLKPDNIVVVAGKVKLLDFGIAKLLAPDESAAASSLTRTYSPRLTPRYAAPEQVTGAPTTTATDVYALGVVLYELLCGHPPYLLEGNSLIALERVIGQEVPRPPSARIRPGEPDSADIAEERGTDPRSLTERLRGDLDAICLKALRKDPSERYESVAALADDLRRHLDGGAVRARPQTRRYRLAKFVQRNRLAVGLASAAALFLVLGSAVSAWQAAVARRQSELRLEEAERATVARDYLISWLTTFDPNRLEGQREFTVDEIVEVGFEHLGSLQAQPQVRAAVMNSLGGILFNFGRWSRADSVYRAAYAALSSRGPHPDLAVSMMGIGEIWRARTQYDSARTWFEEALRVRSATLEPSDPRLGETEDALAFTLYNLATSGVPDLQRDSLLTRAYALRRDVAGNAAFPPLLRASALEGLGDIEVERDDNAAAVRAYREAHALRVEALGTANPENGFLLWGLADALMASGDPEGAEQAYRDALATLREVYPESNPAVATAHYNLGRFLDNTARPHDAIAEYRHSIDEWAGTGEDTHMWAGWSWVGLGMALLRTDSARAAEHALRRGLEIYESLPSGDDAMKARARADLGAALAAQGRDADALVELRAAWEVYMLADSARAAADLARRIADLEARTAAAGNRRKPGS